MPCIYSECKVKNVRIRAASNIMEREEHGYHLYGDDSHIRNITPPIATKRGRRGLIPIAAQKRIHIVAFDDFKL